MSTQHDAALLLVNFGGPRIFREIGPFMRELLTDQDVIQTAWPAWVHRAFDPGIITQTPRPSTERSRDAHAGRASPRPLGAPWAGSLPRSGTHATDGGR